MASTLFDTPPPKPFLDVLAEDPRIDPNQGLLANVGGNLAVAGDKVMRRNMYRNRAQQMNAALASWDQQQAANRRRMGMAKAAAGGVGGALAGFFRGPLGGAASSLGQTALGAGAGYLKNKYEQANVFDPNMSPEMRNQQMWTDVGAGALVGNPQARRRLFTKTTNVRGPVPALPAGAGLGARLARPFAKGPIIQSTTQGRPFKALGALSLYGGAPYFANLMDTTRKGARKAQEFIQSDAFNRFAGEAPGYLNTATDTANKIQAAIQDPKTQAALKDPAAYGQTLATNAARTFGQTEAAQAGISTLANTLGAGVGGSLVGGAGGHILGQLFAGDDERLGYDQRRRREAMRNMLGWGGTIAGGFAAPYLTAKYAPGLIPGIVSKVTGMPAAGAAPAAPAAPAAAPAAPPAVPKV